MDNCNLPSYSDLNGNLDGCFGGMNDSNNKISIGLNNIETLSGICASLNALNGALGGLTGHLGALNKNSKGCGWKTFSGCAGMSGLCGSTSACSLGGSTNLGMSNCGIDKVDGSCGQFGGGNFFPGACFGGSTTNLDSMISPCCPGYPTKHGGEMANRKLTLNLLFSFQYAIQEY